MPSNTLFTTIRTEGALLPPDLLQRIVDGDPSLSGLTAESYHRPGEKLNEVINQSWNTLQGIWVNFKTARDRLPAGDVGTTLTRERWLLPLFRELDYGRLGIASAGDFTIDDKNYPVSHKSADGLPVHLISYQLDLDRRTPGVAGASTASPHSLVQVLLNRTETQTWGFLSNGYKLRILRDNASLTRQAYVEFDLQAMLDGEVYSDFVLVWLLCHQSRVEGGRDCWLEKWAQTAQQQGTRALDQLRDGVQAAIEALGIGFLDHPQNTLLRDRLHSGDLSAQDYYRQLLRLVYRLLVMFTAEDRELLYDPASTESARKRYSEHYSMRRLRRIAERLKGTRHADLYEALRLVTRLLGGEIEGAASLGLPVLDSFLFRDVSLADLINCPITNVHLLDAVRALAFVEDTRTKTLRTIDYRNLGPEELGSVYESLLELHPHINIAAKTFALATAGGNERKTTGSYYTPTSLINALLDSALAPVIAEARSKADPETALLDLKVCDPACGSGHFLIAAAHRIASELARVRTGEEAPAPNAHRAALRDVIGHCIYGVDINEMAVELCKVNLWLEALEPGKPLNFLDHRIQVGNSLIGTTPVLMANGIPDDAFNPIEGDDKEDAAWLKKLNRQERKEREKLASGQSHFLHMVEQAANYHAIAEAVNQLDEIPDDTLAGLRRKEQAYAEFDQNPERQKAQILADAWCAAFVGDKAVSDRLPLMTDLQYRRLQESPLDSRFEAVRQYSSSLKTRYQFFHWHVAFPDVFIVPENLEDSENTQAGWSGGFDCILGNPPWDIVKEDSPIGNANLERLKEWFKHNKYAVLSGRRDLYKLFSVLNQTLLREKGYLGLIVPIGMFVEDDSKDLREQLYQSNGSILRLQHFQNSQKSFFPHVHASYRFVNFTFTPSVNNIHRYSTVVQSPQLISDATWIEVEREALNKELGNDLAAVLYPDKKYYEIHSHLIGSLRQSPREDFTVVAEFHATSDNKLSVKEPTSSDWQTLKNRSIHQFTHLYAEGGWSVTEADVLERCARKGLDTDIWMDDVRRLLFRDIARNDDARTLICCLAPKGFVSTYDTPMVVPNSINPKYLSQHLGYLCGVLNSFTFDFLIRPFVDKHIKGYVLQRLPVPRFDPENRQMLKIAEWSISLSEEFPNYKRLAPERQQNLIDIWTNIDALVANLVGLSLEELEFVMNTFPIIRGDDEKTHGEYRTKRAVLEAWSNLP